MGADVVEDYLMLRDLYAKDNAVGVGNAHRLLARKRRILWKLPKESAFYNAKRSEKS